MSSQLVVRSNGDGERLKSRASSCTSNQKTIRTLTKFDKIKMRINVGFKATPAGPETKPRWNKKRYRRIKIARPKVAT